MLIEHVTLYDNMTAVEEIEIEEIEVDDTERQEAPVDPRLLNLSPSAKLAVQRFGGDVDEACYQASRFINAFRNPPAWAIELHGAQRTGWKSFDREGRV